MGLKALLFSRWRHYPFLNKKLWVCYLFAIISNIISYGQSPQRITVVAQSGVIKQSTTDHLLNYYNYSGNAVPISLDGMWSGNKSLFILSIFFQSAILRPSGVPAGYYQFNDIHHREGELKLEYFRELVTKSQVLAASIGLSNCSYSATQLEHYKSLLSVDGEGYRQSYARSILNLSPALMLKVQHRKNSLVLKYTHSLLSSTTRPDDNYVKQLGLPVHRYTTSRFTSAYFSCRYQRILFNGTGVTAEYNITHRKYSGDNSYDYLRHSFTMGLYKTF